MDSSPRFGESTRLPSISISPNPPDRFRPSDQTSSFSSGYSPSNAIKIPGLQREEPPPPPLPPPPLPFHDYPAPDYRDHSRGPGSSSMGDKSFFGSFTNSLGDERPAYKRWDGASKPESDEGYASLSSTMSRESLPGGFGLHHNRFQFQSSADAYCDKLKNKLNPIRTLDLKSPTSRSGLSASATDVTPPRLPRYPPALTVLPIHTRPSVLGSPDRFTQTPLYSAVSPRSAPFQLNGHGDYRSPNDLGDLERSPRHHPRRLNSGSLHDDAAMGGHGGYDVHGAEDMEMEETSMRRLRLDDSSRSDVHTIGMKRRASSPPGDEPTHGFQTPSDMVRRRDVGSRGSPTPRLTTIPQGSISSVSSAGRSGSFASTFSMAGTSMTSVNSYGRRSPGGLSPGGMSPITSEPGYESPYTTPVSLTQSPGEPMGRPQHQRTISESMPMSMTQPLRAADIKVQRLKGRGGWYMCECCPKKPKKFRTTEDLSAHEAEKQYECSYCGNRFKNKNEAERHQNSLHVRRHSWSCKALVGYARAFHDSTTRAGKYDVCGYCGDEFPRTGLRLPGGAREATEADWDDRIRHLTEVHKFRECNSSKKFFRADHFRQHLKHSHAGTSGKWTNMLENACMMDEDPTPR